MSTFKIDLPTPNFPDCNIIEMGNNIWKILYLVSLLKVEPLHCPQNYQLVLLSHEKNILFVLLHVLKYLEINYYPISQHFILLVDTADLLY